MNLTVHAKNEMSRWFPRGLRIVAYGSAGSTGKPGPNACRAWKLCGWQRGNVSDLTLDVPRRLPQVYRALGVQPELGAIAE